MTTSDRGIETATNVQAILEHMTIITASLATIRDLDGLARAIHHVVENTISVEYSGIYMLDFTTDRLRLWYTKGFTQQELEEAERTAWDRHPGWVIRNKQMLHIPDTSADDRSKNSNRSFPVRSRLWMPIICDDDAIGAMGLASSNIDAFTREHISILQYAATTSGFMFANLRARFALEKQLLLAEEQRQELVALSSPVVEVGDGIVVLPIIGRMEEQRAQQMTEKLLALIAGQTIRIVILDLTGVATIDSASIEHLGRMHRAIRLLGSECVFSGISGQTAALMTELGQDLAGWKTFASVRQALFRVAPKAPGIAPTLAKLPAK